MVALRIAVSAIQDRFPDWRIGKWRWWGFQAMILSENTAVRRSTIPRKQHIIITSSWMPNIDVARFLWIIHFCQNLGEKGAEIGYFAFFCKLCHIFFLTTMQNESSFDSWVSITNPMSGKRLVLVLDQSDCRILWFVISVKKINRLSWFFVCR